MSEVEDAKRALKACEDGIALITAQQKSNQALVDDYNKRTIEVVNAQNTWGKNKKIREDSQISWDNKKKEIYDNNQEEKLWLHCTSTFDNDDKRNKWCINDFGQGWEYSRNNRKCDQVRPCSLGFCKGFCQKTDVKRWDEAVKQVIKEIGPRPANYNEPKPQNVAEIKQNQTPINIACCAATTNIIGSEVTNSTITQENNCLQNKKSELNQALQSKLQSELQYQPTVQSELQSKLQSELQSQEKDKKNKMMIIIFIIMCVICCCVGIIFMMNDYE